jgi:hypothetical protein
MATSFQLHLHANLHEGRRMVNSLFSFFFEKFFYSFFAVRLFVGSSFICLSAFVIYENGFGSRHTPVWCITLIHFCMQRAAGVGLLDWIDIWQSPFQLQFFKIKNSFCWGLFWRLICSTGLKPSIFYSYLSTFVHKVWWWGNCHFLVDRMWWCDVMWWIIGKEEDPQTPRLSS